MKVSFSPYQLDFKDFKAKHICSEGILLSFEEGQRRSYSLYHPIKSLGDIPIKSFLTDFEKLVLNNGPLRRVKELAVFDNETLNLDVSCYELCSNFKKAEDSKSKIVKIKTPSVLSVLNDFNLETKKKYILDANGNWSDEEFEKFQAKIPKDTIKYLEDPLNDLGFNSEFLLASDFMNYENYDFKVLKPTGFNHSVENSLSKPVVVTSYLDHPLGQVIAALYAKKTKVKEACGLMTHLLFEKNPYSELLSASGDFKFSDSTGLFELLKNEKWNRLL